ncbi:hypothetical protein BH09PSE1_BH09PSE1_26580 [soil metagenome]
MRYQIRKPDYFDNHRKDHSGRPALFTAALIGTVLIWAALASAVIAVL